MAAPAFASISNTTYGTRTNTTITAPSGIANGDVLLAFLFQGSGTPPAAPTPPSGFAQVGSYLTTSSGGFAAQSSVWVKTAASESGDYTFTHVGISTQGVMARITNCTGVNAWNSNNTSTGSTRIFTGVTTSVADCLLVAFGYDWGDNTNDEIAPTGMTEALDIVLVSTFWEVWATAGATGNRTGNCNSAGTNPNGGFLIALAPGSGGGVTTTDLKVWTGTGWAKKIFKAWNGSAWNTKPTKRWNGSSWETV